MDQPEYILDIIKNLSPDFVLKYQKSIEINSLQQLLSDKDIATIINILKLKVLMIHNDLSLPCDFNIEELLTKLSDKDDNLIQYHDCIFYALLIQKSINLAEYMLKEAYEILCKDLNNTDINIIISNLEHINIIIDISIIKKSTFIINNFDENKRLFDLIVKLISSDESSIQKKVAFDIIPKFITCTSKHEIFPQIWRVIQNSKYKTSILINLEKYFLPLEFDKYRFNLLNDNTFWTAMQVNITSQNPLIKKQSLYLLKNAVQIRETYKDNFVDVFYLKNENSHKIAWKNFFILCDISSEKQMHLIEPTFKLYKTLEPLHISWRKCITNIFIFHPHSAVVKYVITKILTLEWPCDADTLIPALDNTFLYENCNENQMIEQLKCYISKLNDTEFRNIIFQFCSLTPSPVPFYFICKCLENVNTKEINLPCIINLLDCSKSVPHLNLRKASVNSVFQIFVKMCESTENIFEEYLIRDLVKIIEMLIDSGGYLPELCWLIKTKSEAVNCKLNTDFHLLPSYYAAFMSILMEVNYECNKEKLADFLREIERTENVESKLNYLCDFRLIILPAYGYDNIFSQLLIICKNFPPNQYKVDIFDQIQLILKENMDLMIFSLEKCFKFLNELKLANKFTFYIICSTNILKKISTRYDPTNCNHAMFRIIQTDLKACKLEYESEIHDNSIKRKVISAYYESKLYLTVIITKIEGDKNICDKINKLYDTNGTELLFPIIEILLNIQTYIFVDNKELIPDYINILERCKTDLFNLRSNEASKILDYFTYILYALEKFDQEPVKSFMDKFTLELFEPRQTNSQFKYAVLKRISSECLSPAVLVEALIYGPILRKDQKIEFDTYDFIMKHNIEIKYFFDSIKSNIQIRYQAINKLIQIFSEEQPTEILLLLQSKYGETAGKRYFGDSQIHLTKLRIMQAIHVILQWINKDHLINLESWLFQCLVTESQQPSVKLLIQWLLVRIYVKLNNIHESIGILFDRAKEITGTSVASIFPILYHLMTTENTDISIICRCINFLLPYTMGQQFNIRYMAQITIKKVYEFHYLSKREINELYGLIYKSIDEVLKQTITDKTVDNILTFSKLCISLETLYLHIPRLLNVCHTEWLPKILINSFEIYFIKVNSDESIKTLQIIPKKIPPHDTIAEPEDMNVQMKINTDINKTTGNLIVVASLIDKAPNLGGLSRTCEAFGVKKLALNNGQLLKNKEYLSLSMSSEKWVETFEVKEENLATYLSQMKRDNFRIVGAEQTADSKMLDNFQFHENTVLLLGNEKSGIPANLIALLDDCIEIPQFGQIRSLNVHVAGACFIWEYAKQHCQKM